MLLDLIASGDVRAVALCYLRAGLSVIPIKTNGSKSPKHAGWREFSDRLPTEAEVNDWFSAGAVGVGIVPGPASGNLVVLDFENNADGSAYAEWRDRLADASAVARCPLVRTPSGGRHLWVRLPEPQPGGRLARYASGRTKIEVRGEGHQVLAPGCPGTCHPSGLTYEFEQLGWLS